jgi:acetyl esterase/lipase
MQRSNLTATHCSVALSVVLAAALAGTASAAEVVADIEYARIANEPLRLDLYMPENGRDAPLLVWAHGGAWERGSKTPMPLGALVDRGYAIASLDFSPASRAPFPGQVHEIKAAVRFLRASAERFGYDATRIGILGASSGGHLAALVGTTNGHPELEGALGEHSEQSSAVQAIVSYFGASNLTTILAQSTPFGLNVREPALTRLLGALPDEQEALARLASPVFHVDANDPPLLLLHGDQDPQMPINQSHELEGAYERQHLPVELIVVHGARHGGEEFFVGDNLERVDAFLDEHLKRHP